MKKSQIRTVIVAAALISLFALAPGLDRTPAAGAAPSAAAAKPQIVLGTKNFTEEYILGQLYKQALEAKGFHVSYKENIGSTEIITTALDSGKINTYPEYTGEIVQDVFHTKTLPATAGATYQLAKKLESKHGNALLKRTPFSDTNVVVVTKATAAKYGLKAITDLQKIPGAKLGGLPECATRANCLIGLRKVYGLKKLGFVPLAGISSYAALNAGTVPVAIGFSTDPVLGKGSKYVVLPDVKHLFGFQNIAPIVSQKLMSAYGPKLAQTMNAVSPLLTTPAMIAMNKAVAVDKQSPQAVAKAFLKANHLL
ncbi:MAG: glycine betaine ABC transporter substrate-binding protein [Gaiellaceae bacterium]